MVLGGPSTSPNSGCCSPQGCTKPWGQDSTSPGQYGGQRRHFFSSSHWVGCRVFSWQIPIKQIVSCRCSRTSCWPWEPSTLVWRCNSLQPCLFSGHRVARLTVQLSVHLGTVWCFNLPANCDSQLELTDNKYLWKNLPSVSPEEAQDPGAGVWGCLSHCWVPARANKGTGGGVSVTEFLWVKSGLTESETIPSSDAWFSTSRFLHQRTLFVSAKLEIHTTCFSRTQKVCLCVCVYVYIYTCIKCKIYRE